jgi:hypothetical protein
MPVSKTRLGVMGALTVIFLLLLPAMFMPHFRTRYPFVFDLFTLYVLFYLLCAALCLGGVKVMRDFYSRAATLMFSIFLFIVCLSTLTYVAICTVRVLNADIPALLGKESMRIHHERARLLGMTPQQMHVLDTEALYDMWLYEYVPFVGYREKARSGTYVNVSVQGYRKTPAAPAQAKAKVYMFGGSTTFGYGVADSQTIAACLQKALNERFGPTAFEVRNYGRVAYNSTQQYILLWRLLREESPPQAVIFLNDFNERLKNPLYTRQMRAAFDLNQMGPVRQILFRFRAQLAYAGYVMRFCLGTKNLENPLFEFASYDQAVRNYRANVGDIGALCARYGIRSFFFLGPIAGFRNAYATHLFCKIPPTPDELTMMERLVSSVADMPVTDLSAALKDYRGQPFIDRWHYTPAVNRLLAGHILSSLTPYLQQSHR